MKNLTRYFLFVSLCAVFAFNAFAQNEKPTARTIEVTGSAESLVTPNEFTFKITLVERLENKQKITIERQESQLRDGLTRIGIDPQKDLTVFDLRSNYVPVRRRNRDVLGTKDYRLKVTDLAKVDKLQELADNLNISTLDLIESTHSELTRLRREAKMEAVRAAKMKAEYMLGAIGERVGKPVNIMEIAEESLGRFVAGGSLSSNSIVSIESNVRRIVDSSDDDTLTFTKIRLRYEVKAVFEIQ
jgi:hypothetical protein